MNREFKVTFYEAIEIVESLPTYQQDDLINIIRRRMVERSRDLLKISKKREQNIPEEK